MGNEFCKGCQDNCLSGLLEQDFSKKNMPEENIIYINSEYMNDKTSPSILYTQNQLSNNNSVYIKGPLRRVNTTTVDKKKLNNIILNYYAKILVKYFRKFKFLKQKMLREIIIENYYISAPNSDLNNKSNNINKNSDILDIDISPNNNHVFLGHKFNMKKEGYGLEIYRDINARFFGYFKNGKKTGFCRFSIYNIENSFYYFGESLNNKISGYGYYENNKKGVKYEGQWKNSTRNGYGIEHYEEGSIYTGTFLNGKKDGIGVYKWIDKSSYEGEWTNNYINGYGKYIYSDGSVYTGSWYYNRMEGLGEYVFASKKSYFGYFKNNLKAGFGMLFNYQEKKAYIGFWEDNKQNGLGEFINDNRIIYGIWNNGKLIQKITSRVELFNKMTNIQKIYLNHFRSNNFSEFYQRITRLLSL